MLQLLISQDNKDYHNLHSFVRIQQMEEKVVKTRVVKHVFKMREITHILEIVQQKARNAINAPKKVSLKDAADQR